MRIRAFTPLRPTPDLAPQIASVPYDVVSREEARRLASNNPLSMLHVVRAEIDLPADTDSYSDSVYARAKENLARMVADHVLIRETEPCIYLYQQQMDDHIQTGLVTLCHLDDYDRGLIKRHEKTRPDKENDRTRLTSDLSANPGPVFLTYRDLEPINQAIESATTDAPLYDFTAEDGIRHTVWRIVGGETLINQFEDAPAFYVADGHHRAASAARVARERMEANPHHSGVEDYNWFLTVLFPKSEIKILSYNRVVADLNAQTPEFFLDTLRKNHGLRDAGSGESTGPGDVRVALGGRWYRINLKSDPQADPADRLDVSQLQDQVLTPVLGIGDPRTDKRINFIGGIRGSTELTRMVDQGSAAVAFALYPVKVAQLMDIADAGQIMPPKSTWFEPKLRSGLFVHTF
jgi:uncharacterized protein (DUF1015 family)